MVRFLRCVFCGDVAVPGDDGCPHPPPPAGDSARPLETQSEPSLRKLTKLGVGRQSAWRSVYRGRQSLWALSHNPAVDRGLRNAYFAERGLVSLAELLQVKLSNIAAPAQLELRWG